MCSIQIDLGICLNRRYMIFAYITKHKLKWYGNVSQSSGLAKTLQGTVSGGKMKR